MQGFSEERVSEALEYAKGVLKRLLSIPTVSPQGDHYEEAAELLARELEGLGFEVEVLRVPESYQRDRCRNASSNPRFIVYGRMKDGEGPVLHFNGHYDVVPGGPGWSVTEPFKPVERDGRIYGRGAVDMKGGIAAALGSFKLLSLEGLKPTVRVEAAFVPDEEIGGDCGTGYLVESLDSAPEYVIIPEPSGLEAPWHGHRGILWLKVLVKGRTAHASTPWLGVNAFLKASQMALELQRALNSLYSSRKSKYRIEPEDAAYPTAMIGGMAGIPGGGKTNQVPGEFYFTIDRRLIPEESVDDAYGELSRVIRWVSYQYGIDYGLEVVQKAEPAINEPGELFDSLREAALAAGVNVRGPVICPGGLDMWYYTTRGSKALAYGPSYHLAHAPDEHIEVREIEALIKVYAGLQIILGRRLQRRS